MKIIMLLFLAALVAANLIVNHFGSYGLLFSSALLIPFDFVCRCIIHERYKGTRLLAVLSALTIAASILTYIVNTQAKSVAIASVCGFIAAQLAAGIFYQCFKSKSYFVKVNGSDLVAIVFDSLLFQFIAFGTIIPTITAGQVCIKLAGGLVWYFLIFKKLKLHEKYIVSR